MRNNKFLNLEEDEQPMCPGCDKEIWPSERSLLALGVSQAPVPRLLGSLHSEALQNNLITIPFLCCVLVCEYSPSTTRDASSARRVG
jgi:hypothetical protein